MTATQTREPARTPREAQSAGSRQLPTAVIGALTTVALVAVAAVSGFLARNDYLTCALLTLCLVPFLTGPSHNRRGGGR